MLPEIKWVLLCLRFASFVGYTARELHELFFTGNFYYRIQYDNPISRFQALVLQAGTYSCSDLPSWVKPVSSLHHSNKKGIGEVVVYSDSHYESV